MRKIWVLLFAGLLLLTASLATAQIIDTEEEDIRADEGLVISKDTTWNGDMDMATNITVKSGSSLTIQDSIITFQVNNTPYFSFIVEEGATLKVTNSHITAPVPYLSYILYCRGTVTLKDSTFDHLGSQMEGNMNVGGIVIESDTTSIDGCTIYFGNVGISVLNTETTINNSRINDTYMAVYTEQADVTIQGCDFENNIYGIYAGGGTITTDKTDFNNCFQGVSGYGINATIKNSVFDDNQIAILLIASLSNTIDSCEFLNNSNAIAISESNSNITNNLVIGGTDGIAIEEGTASISNNIIKGQSVEVTWDTDCTGCTEPKVTGFGSAVRLLDSKGEIKSNEIHHAGVGIYLDSSSPLVQGNNIHNNTEPSAYNASPFIHPDIIATTSTSLPMGVGIFVRWVSDEVPIIMENTISDNENVGVLAVYTKATIDNNIIENNGAFGIQALGVELDKWSDNTLNNPRNYGYSTLISMLITHPYVETDIYPVSITHVDVSVKNQESDTIYEGSTQTTNHMSVFLVSYYTSSPTAKDYRTYNLSFDRGGTVAYETITTTSDEYQNLNVTLPLYRPDLTIENLEVIDAYQEEKATLKVKLKNSGDKKATNLTVQFSWTKDGESKVIATTDIVELDVNEERTVTAYWTPETTGDYEVLVKVDPDRNIQEVYENNNYVEKTVNVEEKSYTWLMIVILLSILVILVLLILYNYLKFKMDGGKP